MPTARRRIAARSLKNPGRCALLLLSGLLSTAAAPDLSVAQSVAIEQQAPVDPYAVFIAEASRRFGVPEGWIRAVMRVESRGDVRAISPAGAMGLMQVMPDTWTDLRLRHSLGSDPFSPRDNILAGAAYLREMHDRYGSPGFLAAYNAGPGNVNKWLRANGDPRTGSISWVEWIEKIPFFETKNYVQRVIENAAVYEQLYPERTAYGRARSAGDFLR